MRGYPFIPIEKGCSPPRDTARARSRLVPRFKRCLVLPTFNSPGHRYHPKWWALEKVTPRLEIWPFLGIFLRCMTQSILKKQNTDEITSYFHHLSSAFDFYLEDHVSKWLGSPTPRFFSIGHVVSGSHKPILRGVCNRKDESVFPEISQPPRCGVKVLAAGLLGNGRSPHPMTGDIYIGVDDHSLWSETRTVKGLPILNHPFFYMETMGVDRPDRTNVVKWIHHFIPVLPGGEKAKKTQDDVDFFLSSGRIRHLLGCPRKLANG